MMETEYGSDNGRRHAESDIERVASEQDDLESSPPRYEIVTYPADFTLEGLVRKYRHGQLTIPGFQRKFVWSRRQATRLIESFLLGLPVPAVFLFVDARDRSYTVIDGQQRLLSIVRFFEGRFEERGKRTVFTLDGLHESSPHRDKTYEDLRESDPVSFNTLNDAVLRAFVVRQLDRVPLRGPCSGSVLPARRPQRRPTRGELRDPTDRASISEPGSRQDHRSARTVRGGLPGSVHDPRSEHASARFLGQHHACPPHHRSLAAARADDSARTRVDLREQSCGAGGAAGDPRTHRVGENDNLRRTTPGAVGEDRLADDLHVQHVHIQLHCDRHRGLGATSRRIRGLNAASMPLVLLFAVVVRDVTTLGAKNEVMGWRTRDRAGS